MFRNNLADLPAIKLPDGYRLRHFQPGDEPAWEAIISASFEEKAAGTFQRRIGSQVAFRAERVKFVTFRGLPVATATAWHEAQYGPTVGYLHMVGTLPDHRGRHLGMWASVAALQQHAAEGFSSAVLQTDDFRHAAIRVYLKLGFTPLLVHENQRQRWRTVLGSLELSAEQRGAAERWLAQPIRAVAELHRHRSAVAWTNKEVEACRGDNEWCD